MQEYLCPFEWVLNFGYTHYSISFALMATQPIAVIQDSTPHTDMLDAYARMNFNTEYKQSLKTSSIK